MKKLFMVSVVFLLLTFYFVDLSEAQNGNFVLKVDAPVELIKKPAPLLWVGGAEDGSPIVLTKNSSIYNQNFRNENDFQVFFLRGGILIFRTFEPLPNFGGNF